MSKKSHLAKPLLIEEVPFDLRPYLEFENQYPEIIDGVSRFMKINRLCCKCNQIKTIKVTTIRQALKNNKYTGLCVSCSLKKLNTRERKKGAQAENWKGGKITDKKGYILIYSPEHPEYRDTHKYIFEHRLVMEKSIGRYLLNNETVHHKNGIRFDNRIENLELWNSNHGNGCRYKDMNVEQLENLIVMLQNILKEKL